MRKRLWIIAGGVLTVLLLVGAVGAMAVYAESPTPPIPSVGPGGQGQFGNGGHPLDQAELTAAAKALGITADELSAQLKSGKTLEQIATAQGVDIKTVMQALQAARPMMLGSTELDAAAKALGMTPADLLTALKSGKTLADISTEKGVTLQVVQDAIQAAHKAELTTQINQAVTDGKMTQDKATWLLEGLDKGYLDGPGGFGFGFGPGFGPGGPHMRGGQQPPTAATATP